MNVKNEKKMHMTTGFETQYIWGQLLIKGLLNNNQDSM